MQKGFTLETEGSNNFYKAEEGKGFVVGLIANDVVTKNTVSVSDWSTVPTTSVFAPLVTTPEYYNKSLLNKARGLAWDAYNEAVTKYGKGDVSEKYRRLANELKLKATIYFGITDLETGEQKVISQSLKAKGDTHDKGGNILYNAIMELQDELEDYPIKITNGGKGAWNARPVLKPTPEQREAFANRKEVDLEVYASCMTELTEELEKEVLGRVALHYGLDFSSIGVVTAEPKEADLPF